MELKLFDFAKNTAFTVAIRCCVFVFSLITSIAIARALGPFGKGIYSMAILLPNLIMKFTNLGIGPATVYNVCQKQVSRSIIFGNNIIFSSVIGIFSYAVGALLVIIFHDVFFHGIEKFYLFLALLVAPLIAFNINMLHILLGLQKIKTYNIMSMLYSLLLFLGVIFSLFILHLNVLGIIIATILSLAVVNIVIFYNIKKSIKKITLRLNFIYLKNAFKYGIPSNVGNIMRYLNIRFDILLVNAFLNPTAVGHYAVAAGIVEQSWLISQSAGLVLFPRISAEGDENVRKELTPIVCRNIVLLTSIMAIILFLAGPSLVKLLFSEVFILAVIPLRILIPGIVTFSVWRLLYDDIAGRGKPVLNVYVNTFAVIVNILLNIIWIPRYGIAGAAWATTVSYSIAMIGALVVYQRITNISLSKIFIPCYSDFALYSKFLVLLKKKMIGPNRRSMDGG